MREWLLLGVIAVGGILGVWLLFFKSLAALYELWQSGREFERLKREAASRRMQRPSELMQKKPTPIYEDNDDSPVVSQAMLDSLSDDQADPRLLPQQRESTPSPEPPPAEEDDLLAPEPQEESRQEEATQQPSQPESSQPEAAPAEPTPAEPSGDTTTSSSPPPTFPLPPASSASPESESPPEAEQEESSPSDKPESPPRYE